MTDHRTSPQTPDAAGVNRGRRRLLQVLGATGLTVTASTAIPSKWAEPVMEIGVLPVHAQASPFDPPPVAECIPIPTPADIGLTVDMSGSIAGSVEQAKQALVTFVNARDLSRDVIGLVSFDTETLQRQPLTQDRGALINTIGSLSAAGATSIAYGIGAGQDLLESGPTTPGNAQIMVLFSDGMANETNPFQTADFPPARDAALNAANQAKAAGIRIITIGIGDSFNEAIDLMRNIASSPNDFFYVSNLSELEEALSAGCQPG